MRVLTFKYVDNVISYILHLNKRFFFSFLSFYRKKYSMFLTRSTGEKNISTKEDAPQIFSCLMHSHMMHMAVMRFAMMRLAMMQLSMMRLAMMQLA